jgi:hypothetical protein
MAKKKPVAARDSVMFPPPKGVTLPPQKVVAFDVETNTLTLEGPTPPELIEAAAVERQRLDFLPRFKRYHENCLRAVLPHYGSRQAHIPAGWWDDVQWRVRHVDLPNDAPGTAHDALLALRHGLSVVDRLAKLDDWPEEIDRAFCELIDFGKLLQRMDDRRYEYDVGAHQRQVGTLASGRKVAAAEKRQTTGERYAEIRRGYALWSKNRRTGRVSEKQLREEYAGTIGTSPATVYRAVNEKPKPKK